MDQLLNENLIPARDLGEARDAYRKKDLKASRLAHADVAVPRNFTLDLKLSPEELQGYFAEHQEAHLDTSSENVKSIIFGGLDGVVTIFAIVAGCVGASITPSQVVIVGIGNLLADAFSMGFGEYISSKAESEYINAERTREQWEIENYPEGEKGEMIELYQAKYGISYEDAATMIEIAFKYPKFFLKHMMIEELGLKLDDDKTSPLRRGTLMFISFGLFGLIPLCGFIIYLVISNRGLKEGSPGNVHFAFAFTCCITLLTLFVLGVLKATFSAQNPLLSGFTMTLNGAVASVAAYGSGALLQNFVGALA